MPVVGSISRLMQRTNVDLPLPDRPITTNISSSLISKDTSFTAITCPVCSSISCLVEPLPELAIILSGSVPKTFQTFWHEILILFSSIFPPMHDTKWEKFQVEVILEITGSGQRELLISDIVLGEWGRRIGLRIFN